MTTKDQKRLKPTIKLIKSG